MTDRPPLPPFNRETAAQKVQAAEDAWNTRDPERVAVAYSDDSVRRNRDTFITGRTEIVAFLTSTSGGYDVVTNDTPAGPRNHSETSSTRGRTSVLEPEGHRRHPPPRDAHTVICSGVNVLELFT